MSCLQFDKHSMLCVTSNPLVNLPVIPVLLCKKSVFGFNLLQNLSPVWKDLLYLWKEQQNLWKEQQNLWKERRNRRTFRSKWRDDRRVVPSLRRAAPSAKSARESQTRAAPPLKWDDAEVIPPGFEARRPWLKNGSGEDADPPSSRCPSLLQGHSHNPPVNPVIPVILSKNPLYSVLCGGFLSDRAIHIPLSPSTRMMATTMVWGSGTVVISPLFDMNALPMKLFPKSL